MQWRRNKGFSLVELSIVLVILGLLTGGILAGQSLIRAAELRSVSTDLNRFTGSINTFRDKYFALPGDMTNAFAFWGTAAGCTNASVTVTAAGCNGDGNGLVNIGLESYRGWQQLALAGLLEGSYSGVNGGGTGCGNSCDSVAGTNVPRSRLSNGGYDMVRTGQDPVGDAAALYTGIFSRGNFNAFIFGTKQANFYYDQPILKPEELWNLDTKMDDGRPQSGKVYTYKFNTPGCVTTNVDATAAYALNNSATACPLLMMW